MDLNEQIKQLEIDLQEISDLLEKAERKRVQEVLKQEQDKVEREIVAKRLQKEQREKREADPSSATKAAYTVKITNYGWDQSDKFVKIYITLNGVHKVPAENVEVTFTDRGFSLLVKELGGKNHEMALRSLMSPISAKDSCKKIKTDMVIVMCKKTATKNWECLTQAEKQAKDKDKPKTDENADPSDGLMSMLKKVYSEGDDDMKRTINKAWTESQEKRATGGGLGDMMEL